MIKTNPVKNPTPAKMSKIVVDKLNQATKIQDFPQGARIATVKALHERNFTARKIAKFLNMSGKTVLEYIDKDIDDKWAQYKNAIDRIFQERKDLIRFKANDVIEYKLQDKDKVEFKDVIALYRVLNESDRVIPQHASLNQIINVHPALERKIIVNDTQD